MIPYLEAEISGLLTVESQRSVVREYLQMRVLQSLQRAGAMIPLAFHGGTALRILYRLPRYSEDLDFALERQPEQYSFRDYLTAIQRDMMAESYAVDIKLNDRHVVHSAFVRFRGLMHQLGISPHVDEVLSIKIEIDTRPPENAILDTTLVRHHADLNLQHHDRASLLAGKVHAILQRDYVKGRDWYDLYWYLSQREWPSPNVDMLNAALRQSGWQAGSITHGNWSDYVRVRLESLTWPRVVSDVERFLLNQQELTEFKKSNIGSLLASAHTRMGG